MDNLLGGGPKKVLEVDEKELLNQLLNGELDFFDYGFDDKWVHFQRVYKSLNVLGKEVKRVGDLAQAAMIRSTFGGL